MNGLSPTSHLLLVIAAPLLGAVVAWVIGARGVAAVRQSAAVTAGVTLLLTGWLIVRYLASPEAAAGTPTPRSTCPG